MGWLIDGIANWFKGLLVDAVMASFAGMFGMVNDQVTDIAVQVGQTPAGWNAGVFGMVRTLSETVVLPIAGMILTFVLCYELINMIIEKNNMHDFDTFVLFKWIFKTFIAVFILTNVFNIVMFVFGIAQNAVNESAALIVGDLELGNDAMMGAIRTQLQAMGVGELIGLYLETQIVKLCMGIMSIIIFIVVFGRMLEIYLVISIAPIPMSTMINREWGSMGNNYLKSLAALAFQGFLIMVCVGIYAVLVSVIGTGGDIHGAIWTVAGYTALLCFMLLKSGGIAKSIFNAS